MDVTLQTVLFFEITFCGGRGEGTVLPNGVKVAVSDNSQKCQKLTNMGLTSGLQLFLMYFI